MKKYILFLFLSFGFLGYIPAQPSYKLNNNTILFQSPKGDMRIELCTDNMFRITKSINQSFRKNENWMVVKYDFDPVKYTIQAKENEDIIETATLIVSVKADPWRIAVKNKNSIIYEELSSNAATPANECALQPDEHFFGFGERMDFLDQRGQKVHLNVELGRGTKPAVGGKDILRANYCPVPYFMSNKGYAIFFHTASPTDWDMGWSNHDKYTYSAEEGELDYYLIAGSSIEEMLQSYQTLTGVCPLMPRSTYGLHIGSYSGGTWGHETSASDKYPVDLVHRLRQEKIPFDILWLDSTWRLFNKRFGNGGCCFEFNSTFKNPQAMIDSIYSNHVDMFGLHIRAIVDDGTRNTLYEDAKTAGVTFSKADYDGVINFFDENAANWWWKNGAMKIASMGVKFVKTDCGGTLRFPDGTIFDKDFHVPGLDQKTSSEELHNLFPIAYAKVPYEKFGIYNKQRGFNHTREGYAGIQRYPFIWAGDWGTEWQWFEPVIRGGLNIGLSGIGYWSHCMGGFEQYSPYDTDLYLRWCQFGMFSPVSILFGMDHPRYHEPWTYGPEAMKIFIKYDSLRYAHIPYIYSNAYRMYKSTRPLMTPLVYDYLNDENTYQISDQYMFGPSMMICPVTTKSALSRPVYFPGGKWLDFWTGERIDGRQRKSFLTPIDLMPIFIKGGAIIPMQPTLQYLKEKPVKEITLRVFPEGCSSYDLYEDDGTSMDYQKGIFAITHIESDLKNNVWVLNINKTNGKYKAQIHKYNVEVYLDNKPDSVSLNGKRIPENNSIQSWSWDKIKKCAYIKTDVTNKNQIVLKVN